MTAKKAIVAARREIAEDLARERGLLPSEWKYVFDASDVYGRFRDDVWIARVTRLPGMSRGDLERIDRIMDAVEMLPWRNKTMGEVKR